MRKGYTKLILAFIVAGILSGIVSFLMNLATNYPPLAAATADKPWIVFGSLIVSFVLSLLLSLYLFRDTLPWDDVSMKQSEVPGSGQSETSPLLDVQNSALPGKSYQELIGRDTQITEIMTALADSSGRWIAGIDGVGGIGKTALAREIADRCQSQRLFEYIVWDQSPKTFASKSDGPTRPMTFESVLDFIGRELGATDMPRLDESQKVTRLSGLLKAKRVLIVLDNMETAKDPQEDLLEKLAPLLNPSKVMATSRYRFRGEKFAIHLQGLEEEAALEFIKKNAKARGLSRVAETSRTNLKKIVSATGGSPLALNFVIGQLESMEVSVVLEQLQLASLPEGINDEDDYIRFYKYIYLPSWELLTEPGKKLLVDMTHFPPNSGGDFAAVSAVSNLNPSALRPVIDELWRRAFLEITESSVADKVRYYLHPLTEYFVLSDIVKIL